jgi:hypothetical protein
MATGRRLLTIVPQLTRRSWEDVAPELQRFLARLWDSEGNGIPAGWGKVIPPAVTPGTTGSMGAGNTAGWAAADHVHPVATGVVSGLSNTNEQGTSSSIPRLDHKHKRDVRVQAADADIGTRNAINFESSPNVAVSVVDEPGGDKVTVTADLTASAAIQLTHRPHTHNVVDILGAATATTTENVLEPRHPQPHTHQHFDLADYATWEAAIIAAAVAAVPGGTPEQVLEPRRPQPHTHLSSDLPDFATAVAAVSPPTVLDPMFLMAGAPKPHTHDAVDLYNVVSVENSGSPGTALGLGDFILASQIFGG